MVVTNFMIYTAHRMLLGDEAWGTCVCVWGGEEKCVQGLVGECERKNHWEDLGISVRIILQWILKTYEGFSSINLAQDRDK